MTKTTLVHSALVFSAFSGAKIRSALVAALALGVGVSPAFAEDGPAMRQVFQQFNRPVRAEPAPQPTAQTAPAPQARGFIPMIFQRPAVRQEPRALGFAPVSLTPPERYLPRGAVDRANPARSQPQPAFDNSQTERGISDKPRETRPRLRAARPDASRHEGSLPGWSGEGRGIAVAVNYCVRLCDGYAFPVGFANSGSQEAQEAACQLACPSAEVAMFTAPAGAKDIDEAIRNGRPYSSIPNAFKYRTARYDAACTCRPKGSTTSSAALLTDFTLRRGDLAMTRIGVRHFDGSERFPYRANTFSDALAKLTDKKEVAIVRGMEAASLRGVISVNASATVRTRVTAEIRQAERVAANAAPSEMRRLKGGFEEIRRPQMGPYPVRVVNRPARFVAMN